MSENNVQGKTKLCKHCQSEIPKKAKVCPNCRKKQSGLGKWIVIIVVIIAIGGAAASGGGDKDEVKKTGEVSTTQDSGDKNTEQSGDKENNDSQNNAATEEPETVSNEFKVGDIVETKDVKISFISAKEYISDNEFLQPAEGKMYYRMEFEFENIGDKDQVISSMLDWNCYADDYVADQSWVGDDVLDATISPGKKAKGALYYEVPKDVKSITIEYETDFWSSNKIVFIAK